MDEFSMAKRAVIILVILAGYNAFCAFFSYRIKPVEASITMAPSAYTFGPSGQVTEELELFEVPSDVFFAVSAAIALVDGEIVLNKVIAIIKKAKIRCFI
jgi:hypothetical protein